jgi:hypothetical protein
MPTTKVPKRCFNCKWFATVDDGYSNVTVELTTAHCLKDKNKYLPCEESYSWKYENSETKDCKEMRVAEKCKDYKFSDNQIRLDIEGEVKIEDWEKSDKSLYKQAKKYGLK